MKNLHKKYAALTAALIASPALAQTAGTFDFDPAPIATQSSSTMTTVATAGVGVLGLGIAIGVGFRYARRWLKG